MAGAWALLGVARLLTALLPFRTVGRLLGQRRSVAGSPAPLAPLAERDLLRARRIGWSVRTAAEHAPWRADCFPQALTARFLLRVLGVPHQVDFGLRRDDDGQLAAHAWVIAGRTTVTGGTGAGYARVGSFQWEPRRPRASGARPDETP